MKILTLQFSAKIYTSYGQQAYICGNVPELGNWQPSKGLKLYTDQNMYPSWSSFRFIHIRQNTPLQFKICILSYNGFIIRWEVLPFNNNRKMLASSNMLIFFQEGCEQIQISKIDPLPRIQVRNRKTLQILNDLDSDSSSSKEFWKDYLDDDEDSPVYYRNFVSAVMRIHQSQGQEQIQFRLDEEVKYSQQGAFFDYSIQYQHSNYFILFDSQDTTYQHQNKGKSNESICINLKNKEHQQNAERIRYLANAIVSGKQYILVAHLFINNNSLLSVEELLKVSLQWKTVIHISKELIKQCAKIVEFGVNMIILQNQQALKEAFSILNLSGYKPKMVKPLLYVIQIPTYRRTYIYCASCQQEQFLDTINKQNTSQQKISKINELLSISPYFPTQKILMRILLERQKVLFNKVKYGKRIILLTIKNSRQIDKKIINLLISIASSKNHEVYIIQQDRLTGIERYFPITCKDRLMVTSSTGEMYASGQRTSSIFQILSLSPRKFQQKYDQIIKAVGPDNHCKIQCTKKNTLLVEFSQDEIGNCVRKFIINLVLQMNSKSLAKLVVISKQQSNAIEIKPFCVSSDFYIQSIISGAFKADNFSKSLILGIDYWSSQKTLSLLEKNLKNNQNIIYQGFYCAKEDCHYTNFCKPMITETNLITLLQSLVQQSLNTPWNRSPAQTNQTDAD